MLQTFKIIWLITRFYLWMHAFYNLGFCCWFLLLLHDFLTPLCIHCCQMLFKQLKKSLNIIKIHVHLNKYIFLELLFRRYMQTKTVKKKEYFSLISLLHLFFSPLRYRISNKQNWRPSKKRNPHSHEQNYYILCSLFF